MRFITVALACVSIVATLACLERVTAAAATGANSPAASACPFTSVLATFDGKTYATAFAGSRPFTGTVHATLYTATEKFGTRFPVSIAARGRDNTFRSSPIALVDPSAEALEAAEITFEGTASACVDHVHIIPPRNDDPRVRDAFAGIDRTQPPIPFLKEIASGATPSCPHPYASARVDGSAVYPVYPEISKMRGETGTARIRVDLDATGAVVDASVFESSGSSALDEAAQAAAARTHYLPQLFLCEGVAGSYLFRAQFTGGPR